MLRIKYNQFSYQGRFNLLNSNPVLVARCFQYRVEIFFKEIVIDSSIRKTKCNAILVEFQIRGSLHAPTLTKDYKEEYISSFENIIHVTLAQETEQPELYKLVITYRYSHPEMFCKNMFLKISQNSQKSTCAKVFFK